MNPKKLYKTAFDALVSLGANPFHSSFLAKECLLFAQNNLGLVCVSNTKPPEPKDDGDSRWEDGDGLVCFVSRKHKTAELFQRSLNVRPTD